MSNFLSLLTISILGVAVSASGALGAPVAAAAAPGSPMLSCTSAGAGGSLFKQLVVEQGPAGLVIKAEAYNGGGLTDVKILESISTPVSSKYVLDVNTGSKTSFVMYGKQAVIVYEAEEAGDSDDNGAEVEFLKCK